MPDSPITPEAVIRRIAQMAHVIGWQAGVGGMETAGGIVSYLAAHPEMTERVLRDGMFADGVSMDWPREGCLTHQTNDGRIVHPSEAREAIAVRDAALAATRPTTPAVGEG